MFVVARPAPALADEPASGTVPALRPTRNELVIVPALGGNSDIGVQFGAAMSMARFEPGYRPYLWRLDAVSAMSVKDDLRGLRPVQQYHGFRIDLPGFLSPRLRADIRFNFLRAVDYEWYGIGNRTGIDPRPAPPDAASANQYVSENVRLRTLFRIQVGLPFEIAVATNFRYEFPSVYPGSALADDVATRRVIGDEPGFLETIGAGIFIDQRDNEFVPRAGYFYQIGASETVGTEQDIRYGEVSAVLSHYAPLGNKDFVFASRMIGSYKFGNIPFYDLQTGGVFDPIILVGGNRGIRGIPQGRYAGPLKLVTNCELRATPIPAFHVFQWLVRPGASAFFDAGRVFSDFAYPQAKDGRQIGFKYSVGGGFFFQWDEATVFRVEMAYSPDSLTGSGVPLSFYFENGILF